MGTPLVWSLTVAVVVVAIFALLPATMALAVQKSFKYYKLKITWLRAMFDVHMCVVFFSSLCRPICLMAECLHTRQYVCLFGGQFRVVLRGKAAKGYKDHLLVEASLLSLYFHIEYKDSLNQSNSWIFLFLLFFWQELLGHGL